MLSKVLQVCFFIIVSLSFSLVLASSVSASSKHSTLPSSGTASEDPNTGRGSIHSSEGLTIQSTQYLTDGSISIHNSGTYVTVSGNTRAYSSVDSIAVKLYLQQWNSRLKEWQESYVDTFENFNSISVMGSRGIYLNSGTYRVRGIHWIVQDGLIERDTSISHYISI